MDRLTQAMRLVFRKWKLQSFYFYLGIVGLGTAFAVLILTLGYFLHEFQYDRHIPDNDRIYLISMSEEERNMTPIALAATLQETIPGIQSSAIFDFREEGFYYQEDEVFTTKAANVSPAFYQVFDVKFLHGSKPEVMQPSEIYITESCANKFFGKTDVVGQTLSTKSDVGYIDNYTIRGVLEDFPENSSLQADVFYSGSSFPQPDFVYGKPALYAYGWILLEKYTSIKQVKSQLPGFYQAYGFSAESEIEFTPLSKLHFSDDTELQEVFYAASTRLAIILGSIALLILIIAGINYVNLSMAKSLEYVKEVGIRKTLGATDRQVVVQFLVDSLSHFIVAIPLSYVLAWLIAPRFFDFLAIQTAPGYIFHIGVFGLILLIAALFSIPCGLYPAFMLISKRTNQLLHHTKRSFRINLSLRKTLVVTQYALSIVLIILSVGVRKQVQLLQNRPLGFDKEQLLVFSDVSLRTNYQSFKNDLLAVPNVVSMSSSTLQVGSRMNKSSDTTRQIQTIIGDFDLVRTLGVEFLSGSDFDTHNAHHRKYNADYMLMEPGKEDEFMLKLRERPILVTQDLVTHYDLKDPIGKVFYDEKGAPQGTVIGVVKPFESGPQQQQNSLKIVLGEYERFYSGNLYVRIAHHHVPETLQHIEKIWKTYLPNHEFSYSFVDEQIDHLYQSEQGLTWVIIILTAISCVLSIMGALGLLALMLKQRVQEIGIRKVLGASVGQIVLMVLRDSIKPILIALLIAFPLGWWAISKWLQDFAYRIEMSWAMFAFSGLLIVGITILTMVIQAIRAALANPVESLRDE